MGRGQKWGSWSTGHGEPDRTRPHRFPWPEAPGRDALQATGIASDAEHAVLGDEGMTEFRRVGLAHYDGTDPLEADHLDRVSDDHVVSRYRGNRRWSPDRPRLRGPRLPTGTRAREPTGLPAGIASSNFRAYERAPSASTATEAFRTGFAPSIRSRVAVTTSTR